LVALVVAVVPNAARADKKGGGKKGPAKHQQSAKKQYDKHQAQAQKQYQHRLDQARKHAEKAEEQARKRAQKAEEQAREHARRYEEWLEKRRDQAAERGVLGDEWWQGWSNRPPLPRGWPFRQESFWPGDWRHAPNGSSWFPGYSRWGISPYNYRYPGGWWNGWYPW
jgi:hypothetical protein